MTKCVREINWNAGQVGKQWVISVEVLKRGYGAAIVDGMIVKYSPLAED